MNLTDAIVKMEVRGNKYSVLLTNLTEEQFKDVLGRLELPVSLDKSEIDLSSLFLDITLKETCGACPEQYDACIGERQVGYLRLRHGYFYVSCPDVGGEVVYSANTDSDGCFETDEREQHLGAAKIAIAAWVVKHPEVKS